MPFGSSSARWLPGWRCFPLPASAVSACQFCSVDGAPAQSSAIALHSAPGARRLEIGGAVAAAVLAGKMAGIYAIQAMESADWTPLPAPWWIVSQPRTSGLSGNTMA